MGCLLSLVEGRGSYAVDGHFKRHHHHQPRWAKICIIVPEIMQRANYDYSCCSNPEHNRTSRPSPERKLLTRPVQTKRGQSKEQEKKMRGPINIYCIDFNLSEWVICTGPAVWRGLWIHACSTIDDDFGRSHYGQVASKLVANNMSTCSSGS